MSMSAAQKTPGTHMAREIEESASVFLSAASADHSVAVEALGLSDFRALYTIARGSSDAAANVLSYEVMRETGKPSTSLPPSIFSLGQGIAMTEAAALVVSQSGASADLVAAAQGARKHGARVLAITNQPRSAVEDEADVTLPIGAGEERAVPATKTVIGSIAAGIALLAALRPDYGARVHESLDAFRIGAAQPHPRAQEIGQALAAADHVYVIGRDAGFGAAQELALKIKECCALHAEAYSASEVLHGPLQLAVKPLFVLLLDTGQPETRDSLDGAESRFRAAGCTVERVRASDTGAGEMPPAMAAALLLRMIYPVVLRAALSLGFDPDAPATLSKVTQTV
jgi:glucosamine--fructose-6-phosphate aminotransferase (isomerizing)